MKLNVILLSALLLSVYASPVLSAQEQGAAHEERIQHYPAEKPVGKKQAQELIVRKEQAIEALLKSKKLTGANLESIHEMTYSLEAAVDELRKHEIAAEKDAIDSLDEAVQALHYASENHKEAEVRSWFAKLMKASGTLKN